MLAFAVFFCYYCGVGRDTMEWNGAWDGYTNLMGRIGLIDIYIGTDTWVRLRTGCKHVIAFTHDRFGNMASLSWLLRPRL